jgi:hypothetical protein
MRHTPSRSARTRTQAGSSLGSRRARGPSDFNANANAGAGAYADPSTPSKPSGGGAGAARRELASGGGDGGASTAPRMRVPVVGTGSSESAERKSVAAGPVRATPESGGQKTDSASYFVQKGAVQPLGEDLAIVCPLVDGRMRDVGASR